MRNLKVWLCLSLLSAFGLAVAAPLGPSAGWGFDVANLDRSCKPCEDFNQFANGGWMAKNPIPAAYPSWGSFNILAENNRDHLREILEAAAKNQSAPRGSNEQKVGDFYAACMDEAKANADGLKPLEPELARIDKVSDLKSLQAEIARLQSVGVRAFFIVDSTQDFKNSTQVIGEIDQSGLGLPDRDYYTKDDDKSKQTRDEYVKHVQKMFELMGEDSAKASAHANTVMDIETSLAKASMTKVQRRDPNAVYHRMAVSELKKLAPTYDWDGYFATQGLAGKGEINVATPDFFKEMDRMLTAVPIADWKTYLRWQLINSAAPRLSAAFVDEDFHFKGTVLTGTKQNLERWKRCVRATDQALGEALGQVYVEKYFTPTAKARALEMVNNLEAALRSDIKTLSWMGDATRQKAIEKLEAFARKIGYPDKWRDYSTLEITRDNHAENMFRANNFEFKRDLNKVGKPLDRTEWGMTPPTVNAYYNPLMNEIVFPAGILQPPFFDPNADDAVNYGGMGAVIGHEMTHGFDDQGSQFDAQGNLKNWWSEDDLMKFKASAACIEKQFDGYEVEKGLHMNGKLVEGESIADLGGLTIAFAAYQKSLEGKPRPKDIDGFTPEQRFFLGFAQIWSTNMRAEYARLLANTDPHPLPRFRLNGTLANAPAFAKAFGCKSGDAMVRPAAERCVIW
ncbi:MAG: M13 family metallopeptidase [Terriglobia bacterium]